MTRKGSCNITVEFGDCDPAGIAFYPNFFRWYDASCRNFFQQCGVPPWRELERRTGVIGTPVVEAGSRYLLPVSYGDEIVVTTWVDEWREKSFVMRHVIRRGDATIAEGREVRIVAIRHPDDASRIRAVKIPEEIRALCT
jgi:4-hydroxybenzoyl-CoA thioesterase